MVPGKIRFDQISSLVQHIHQFNAVWIPRALLDTTIMIW